VPDGQASALRACRNEKPRGVVYLLPSPQELEGITRMGYPA